jgi:hypothetical protein
MLSKSEASAFPNGLEKGGFFGCASRFHSEREGEGAIA